MTATPKKKVSTEKSANVNATHANKSKFLEVEPSSRKHWRDWLETHCNQKESVWVIIHKASSPTPNLSTADVVEEALCFGWIDSVPHKIDATRFKLLLSPRKPKSVWSAVNKRRVESLIASGQMSDAGFAAIRLAQTNGAWNALDSSDRLELPQALSDGLKKNLKASEFFHAMAPSSKRAILQWIGLAKTEETKQRRIQETIVLAALGMRANHPQDKKKLTGTTTQ